MIEPIQNFIEVLRKKPQVSKFDENETKQGMILPVLQLLGWNVWDTEEVKSEYPVEGKKGPEGGRVDYCLKIKGKSEVFLEAKRPSEDLEKHQEQLLDYSFREGVDLAILSSGIFWWFYLPRKKGHWKERKFYAIDIMQQAPGEVSEKFVQLLSRNKIQSGEALQNAKFIYEEMDRQKKIAETLPKAWNKIISGIDSRLLDLLMDTTESICGFRPGDDDVREMITHHRQNLMLPETVLPKTYTKSTEFPGTLKKELTKYTEKGKKLYKEFFQELLEKSKQKIDLIFNEQNIEKEWLSTYPDKSGNSFGYIITKKKPFIELSNWYKDKEKSIFDLLFSNKDDIENKIGSPLEWLRNDNKQNWRIILFFDDGSRDNRETWPDLQKKMIDAMTKFALVFSPIIENINKSKN
jgi:predicted type IV restriction endonuclease